MKKILFFALLFGFLISNRVDAQVLQASSFFRNEFGVKMGLNFQMIEGTPWLPKYNSGFLVGVYKDLMRGKTGFRIEGNICEGHFETIHPVAYFPDGHRPNLPNWDTVQKGDFNTIYFRLPLLLEFKIYKSLVFLIGPEYCQQISVNDNNGAYTKDYSDKGGVGALFTTWSFMGDLGLEAKIKQRISTGVRLCIGLTSVNQGANSTYNNLRDYGSWTFWSLQANIGFRLKGE